MEAYKTFRMKGQPEQVALATKYMHGNVFPGMTYSNGESVIYDVLSLSNPKGIEHDDEVRKKFELEII